jgi:hypothetical protein
MAPKTSKRPVTREDAKRLAAKRKRVSESPGMTKRMNVSGATGNKGSRFGAEETANMMATDPARGGTNPKEERDRKKAQAFFDSVLKKAYGGTMKKKGMAKGGAVAKKKAGGAVAKKKAGGAVAKKMGGGKMMKKGYAKGGKLAKMSKGGRGTIARGSGAARPQRFRKNG